jgi:site-specific DNA-methyltransferase (adenine-specific)
MTIPPDWLDVAILGNCLEWLPKVPDGIATLAVFDPPYGQNYKSSNIKVKERQKILIQADKSAEEARELLVQIVGHLKRIVIPGGQFLIFYASGGRLTLYEEARLRLEKIEGITVVNTLVWFKKAPGNGWRYRSAWESIMHVMNNDDGKSGIWNGGLASMNVLCFDRVIPNVTEHPTKKPVKLLTHLIKNSSNPGDVVIDPTAGEFTTCCAAKACGRHYIGMEIEKKWWEKGCISLNGIKEQLDLPGMSCEAITGEDYMEAGRERAKHTLFNSGNLYDGNAGGDQESVPSEGETESPGLRSDGSGTESSDGTAGQAEPSL